MPVSARGECRAAESICLRRSGARGSRVRGARSRAGRAVAIPITCELEKELSLVAPVGQVPDMTRQVVSVCSGHAVGPPSSTPHSGIETRAPSRKSGAPRGRFFRGSGGCAGPTLNCVSWRAPPNWRAPKRVPRAENQESTEDVSSKDQEVVRVRP
mgnify:CR=1 FL=1